jgi:hypothetical protein
MDAGVIRVHPCSGGRVGRESGAHAGGTPATTAARSETEAHRRLKRLALIWAQAQGYSACALEVGLPRCRYRVDVAAYRAKPNGTACTAVFECKQALIDLRRDNGASEMIRQRLEKLYSRQQLLESNLRIHYPQLRIADSLFAEFDSHDFAAIGHRGYTRVTRELSALQHRLFDCTKFETLIRCRCANLFYLVLPNELFRSSEIPPGWGVLSESREGLTLARKPLWHDIAAEIGLRLLQRIAAAGTRNLNRQLDIRFAESGRLQVG